MQKLRAAWQANDSMVCVGLDTDPAKIPACIRDSQDAVFAFNRAIVDATADLVCAYKPQIAYYAARGAEKQLEETIAYIHDRCPAVPVILDAKRGDIGPTAEMYAREVFDRYHADAVTLNPYMGGDTLRPFLSRADRGVVILCKTSNPGSGDVQDLRVDGEEVWRIIARKAAAEWNRNGNVLLVAGATYPRELAKLRALAPRLPFLVPGVGAQGGNVAEVVRNGSAADGRGLVINSSRAIIYADASENFAAAARAATVELRDAIRGASGQRPAVSGQ
jgi:orotidine-5'-phosphate decarboxylase